MGIDCYLYHYSHDNNSRDYVPAVPKDDFFNAEGYLRESYFSSEHYATQVLFKEAFDGENTFWSMSPKTLLSRLDKAIETTQLRYANDQGYAREQTNNIKTFVARYVKEYEEGYSPFVSVSY